jgi:hypothetical protein
MEKVQKPSNSECYTPLSEPTVFIFFEPVKALLFFSLFLNEISKFLIGPGNFVLLFSSFSLIEIDLFPFLQYQSYIGLWG